MSGSRAGTLVPFGYFALTRIGGTRDLAYLVATSWLPPLWLLVRLTETPLHAAAWQFLLGYLAFISIYEIGYLVNDAWDAKRADGGRTRLGFSPGPVYVLLFGSVRIALWLAIGWMTGWLTNPIWLAGFLALIVAFAQHNLVTSKGLRLASFFELATLRFLLPIAALLGPEALAPAVLAAMLLYVLPRLLGYMESKNLLTLPDRRTPRFGFLFLLSISPLMLFLAYAFGQPVLAELLAYFLIIHGIWWLVGSPRQAAAQSG